MVNRPFACFVVQCVHLLQGQAPPVQPIYCAAPGKLAALLKACDLSREPSTPTCDLTSVNSANEHEFCATRDVVALIRRKRRVQAGVCVPNKDAQWACNLSRRNWQFAYCKSVAACAVLGTFGNSKETRHAATAMGLHSLTLQEEPPYASSIEAQSLRQRQQAPQHRRAPEKNEGLQRDNLAQRWTCGFEADWKTYHISC